MLTKLQDYEGRPFFYRQEVQTSDGVRVFKADGLVKTVKSVKLDGQPSTTLTLRIDEGALVEGGNVLYLTNMAKVKFNETHVLIDEAGYAKVEIYNE